MRLKSVVLPAPFGPTRQRSSPASMLKLRSLVAVRPPKRLTRAFVSRIGDIVDAPRLSTPGCEAREHRSRSEEHTSELQSRVDLVCRLLLEKKKKKYTKQ